MSDQVVEAILKARAGGCQCQEHQEIRHGMCSVIPGRLTTCRSSVLFMFVNQGYPSAMTYSQMCATRMEDLKLGRGIFHLSTEKAVSMREGHSWRKCIHGPSSWNAFGSFLFGSVQSAVPQLRWRRCRPTCWATLRSSSSRWAIFSQPTCSCIGEPEASESGEKAQFSDPEVAGMAAIACIGD